MQHRKLDRSGNRGHFAPQSCKSLTGRGETLAVEVSRTPSATRGIDEPARLAGLTGQVEWRCVAFLFRVAFRIVLVNVLVMLSSLILKKSGIGLTWSLVSLPCVIAAASWVTTVMGPFSWASLISGAIVFLLAGMSFVSINSQLFHLQDAHGRTPPRPPVSRGDVVTYDRCCFCRHSCVRCFFP